MVSDKRMRPYGVLVVTIATATLIIKLAAANTTPTSVTVSANPSCTGSIGQATAQSIAYNEASMIGFANLTD